MMFTKYDVLKKYFGYDGFREKQAEVIDSLAGGRDVLCVMPTGAGKSLCYQIPAIMLNGVTIVVSPLIALMKDQVQSLSNIGIKAAYINSSLSEKVITKVYARIKSNVYKIIYVAPERLFSSEFIDAVSKIEISLLVVDEAHCISKWGHDFRPNYLNIAEFIGKLKTRPIVGAFTATATKQVRQDIVSLLRLNAPFYSISSFDRKNLFLDVRHPDNKDDALLELLKNKSHESGIIYCITRKSVDNVCDLLYKHGYPVTKYHAGLNEETRSKNQEDFICDKKRIMVATSAFGMGIDKSNVSFVIHYNMPKDVESYYQEAGRAGRDGNRAECILLYGEEDIFTNKYLIEHSVDDEGNKVIEYKLLDKMIDYCITDKCLRAFILNYFDEDAPEKCYNCSNCLQINYEFCDVTEQTRIIVDCIKHMKKKYGKGMLVNVLKGSKDKRLLSDHLYELDEYAKFHSLSRNVIEQMVEKLIELGVIVKQGSAYPVLAVGRDLKSSENVVIKIPKRCIGIGQRRGVSKPKEDKLFYILKKLRYELSVQEGIPAYLIFSNAALKDMCLKMPTSKEEFKNVDGVGEYKSLKYADIFISEIEKYIKGE